jgi:hypothetical protein
MLTSCSEETSDPVSPGGGSSASTITIGSGTKPVYTWTGGNVFSISIVRTAAPTIIVWGLSSPGQNGIASPVTHGSGASGTTIIETATAEKTLTAGVPYRVTITRVDNSTEFKEFTPEATATLDPGWTQTPNLSSGSMDPVLTAPYVAFGKVFVSVEQTFGPFLVASTNSGTSWAASYTGIGAPVRSMVLSGTRLLASTATTMYASTDSGKTWTNSHTGLYPSTGSYAMCVSGGTVYVSTGRGTYISTNNGQQWTRKDSTLGFRSMVKLGSTLFASESNLGKLYSSNDEGQTWNTVNVGATDYFAFQVLAENNNLYIATWTGLRVSTNSGSSWTKITPDSLNNSYSVNVTGTTILVGSENGNIWASTNSGTSWKTVGPDGISGNIVRGFAMSGGYVFAAVRTKRVWKRPLSEITG